VKYQFLIGTYGALALSWPFQSACNKLHMTHFLYKKYRLPLFTLLRAPLFCRLLCVLWAFEANHGPSASILYTCMPFCLFFVVIWGFFNKTSVWTQNNVAKQCRTLLGTVCVCWSGAGGWILSIDLPEAQPDWLSNLPGLPPLSPSRSPSHVFTVKWLSYRHIIIHLVLVHPNGWAKTQNNF
jgi:hypothetical protein